MIGKLFNRKKTIPQEEWETITLTLYHRWGEHQVTLQRWIDGDFLNSKAFFPISCVEDKNGNRIKVDVVLDSIPEDYRLKYQEELKKVTLPSFYIFRRLLNRLRRRLGLPYNEDVI